MTTTNAQNNVLAGMQTISISLLQIRSKLVYITQMWNNESLGNLTDADIQALTTFAGVTAAEATQAKGAFDTLLTALGDPGTAGTVAYKLLKMANNIP
jgi:hypothetical protein